MKRAVEKAQRRDSEGGFCRDTEKGEKAIAEAKDKDR